MPAVRARAAEFMHKAITLCRRHRHPRDPARRLRRVLRAHHGRLARALSGRHAACAGSGGAAPGDAGAGDHGHHLPELHHQVPGAEEAAAVALVLRLSRPGQPHRLGQRRGGRADGRHPPHRGRAREGIQAGGPGLCRRLPRRALRRRHGGLRRLLQDAARPGLRRPLPGGDVDREGRRPLLEIRKAREWVGERLRAGGYA